MPTRENTIMYAMYVIGEVESNWDWTGVYRADPITIGMMQNYGQRAEICIERCAAEDPEGYAAFKATAPKLSAAVEQDYGWNWWTGYYVDDAEAAAWQTWAQRDKNHVGQQKLWVDDATGYIETLTGWGLSEDRPQTLIYAMSMYHQSPREAGNVIGACGGSATLDTMHAACMNNGILGRYKNRYNTVYGRLSDWDGESAPPDFGQVQDVGAGSGGQNTGSTGQPSAAVTRIQLDNGVMTLWGSGIYASGLTCYKSAPNTWLPSISKTGEPNPGTNTGGGSSTGNTALDEMRQWLLDHVGAFAYSQGAGRMSPEESGYTDCSALMWYVYHLVTGENIGSWTGDQQNYGEIIAEGNGDLPQDDMQVMDLVFFNWRGYNPSFDHVEAYIGSNQLIGHGGNPHMGPTVKQDANAYARGAHDWRVRRYV